MNSPTRKQILADFKEEVSDHAEQLDELVHRMQSYGKVVNLTGSLCESAIWSEIAEALLAYRALSKSQVRGHCWIDVGSGGGFPGLILGIMLRGKAEAQGLLVEPRKRRTDFLSLCILQIGIKNLQAIRATMSEEGLFAPTLSIREPDWVSARAVFSPDEWRARASKAWPAARYMVHGRAQASRAFQLESSAEWKEQRVEIWRASQVEH